MFLFHSLHLKIKWLYDRFNYAFKLTTCNIYKYIIFLSTLIVNLIKKQKWVKWRTAYGPQCLDSVLSRIGKYFSPNKLHMWHQIKFVRTTHWNPDVMIVEIIFSTGTCFMHGSSLLTNASYITWDRTILKFTFILSSFILSNHIWHGIWGILNDNTRD